MSDPDDLSREDLALIEDPEFYRSGHNKLTRRLAVAVLEYRRREQHETPDAKVEAANEQVLRSHEMQVELSKDLDEARAVIGELRYRVSTLEVTLKTERDRLFEARSAGFARMQAKAVRVLLRQAIRLLKA